MGDGLGSFNGHPNFGVSEVKWFFGNVKVARPGYPVAKSGDHGSGEGQREDGLTDTPTRLGHVITLL